MLRLRSLLFLLTLGLAAGLRADPAFDTWAEDFAAQYVRLSPEQATTVQYFSGEEQDRLDRFLDVRGLAGARARAALAARGLAELAKFAPAGLTPAQRTSAAIFRWQLEQDVGAVAFTRTQFVFTQMGGPHLDLASFLTLTHPIRNPRDVENYLARLAQVGPQLDAGCAEAAASAREGILPPRFVLEKVLGQLDDLLAGAPADSVYVASLKERMAAHGDKIAPSRQREFLAAAEAEVAATIQPALTRVRALIAGQLPRAGAEAGVWRLPDGDKAYAWDLAAATTTTLTPAEVNAIGRKEIARIEAEMDALLRQLGYPDGSIQERVEKLNAARAPSAEPDPRAMLVAQLRGIVADAVRRSAVAFDLRPQAPVTVEREPAFSEKSAAAHYFSPAPDGSAPGYYRVPLADLGPRVTWLGIGMKSTAYHEAVPGHHFQIALQQELAELPRYRKLGIFGDNSAFVEGWALYAEQLANELGWYDDDPYGRLGFLYLQLFRARRLVADTGLHSLHWTRQQVIDFGFTVAETERYVVWPGQACSYMIGRLRILELRAKAQAALGPKFSLKEFHNTVLRGGSVPLPVLAEEVDAWIAAQQGRG